MDLLIAGISMALNAEVILAVAVGIITGIVFGSMPGLTFSTGIILLLPLTFAMDAITGIGMLLGVFIGGMTGGSVSAILLGIPGTPSAAATVMDGYRLTQEGYAGKALGMAVIASIFGGIFSLAGLVVLAPQLAKIALEFGPPEIFALVLFGLSTIISVSSGSTVKGLIAGVLGLMFMTIGLDPVVGAHRYTFGLSAMLSGVDLLAAMIGMFALPQIIRGAAGRDELKKRSVDLKNVHADLPSLSEVGKLLPVMTGSAAIGTGIGSIPGSGGPIAAFLAYNQFRKSSSAKKPSYFEMLKGVAAPEAANNAVTGGALIPMLTLGIPGDTATAILLGALLIHGLKPGPLLFQQNGDLIYGIFAVIFIANLLTLFIQLGGIRFFVRVLKVPKEYLLPVILVLTVIGAFAVNNNPFDIYVMAAFGVLGYFMERYAFPTTPVILALVLGPTLEREFRQALIVSDIGAKIFITRPISLLFLILTAVMIIAPSVRDYLASRKRAA